MSESVKSSNIKARRRAPVPPPAMPRRPFGGFGRVFPEGHRLDLLGFHQHVDPNDYLRHLHEDPGKLLPTVNSVTANISRKL